MHDQHHGHAAEHLFDEMYWLFTRWGAVPQQLLEGRLEELRRGFSEQSEFDAQWSGHLEGFEAAQSAFMEQTDQMANVELL